MADLTNPTTNTPLPGTTSSPDATVPTATKRSLSMVGVITTLVIGIIVGAGSVGGYILANQGTLHLTSQDTTDQASASSTPAPTPQSTPTPTPDPTADWKTYTHKDSLYSFRYPPTWKLTEKSEPDPYTESNTRLYENLSLSANGQEVVALRYPFELNGCGETISRAYIFGDEPVVMTADCGSNMYLGIFDSPYRPGVARDKIEPNLMVSYNYSAEHDAEFKLLAKSFTGLKLLPE